MNYSISKTVAYLQKRIKQIEDMLSDNFSQELVEEKKSYLESISMITFIQANKIDITKKVVTLPFEEGHGYYDFRLMIDNESNDPTHWKEVKKIDGHPAVFGIGDKIITD